MGKMRIGTFIAALLLALGTFSGTALADKAGAALEGPDQAAKGAEITLKIHVTHSADNVFHYVNWVRVKVNGEQIQQWEYSMSHLPEGANFTKEVKLLVKGNCEVEAEANCNMHGSKGPARKTIMMSPSSP
jgi:desulfoferrodoxin (superoxide reductase-like protein)